MARVATKLMTNDAKTINAAEAAHFGKLAADWWDPEGSSAMLHKLNPVRLEFIRAAIDRHFSLERGIRTPLLERTALDVGCGAGLLCEPLARLGASVTGVDAAEESIAVARAHATQSGLDIDYRAGELADQGLGKFDVVTCMEVIEHVEDADAFVALLASHLKPDGKLLLSTPNRTMAAKLLLVEGAERTGQIPRGTHDWDKFLTPEELTDLLAKHGLKVSSISGIAFSPLSGLHLSQNMALNYILGATF